MNFTPEDKLRVTWTDGEVVEGYFYKKDRGYVLVTDLHDSERKIACHPSHCKIEKIDEKSQQKDSSNGTKLT